MHGSEELAPDGTRVLVDGTRIRPSPSITILASNFAELAELLVQRRFVQFLDQINQVDVLERWFVPSHVWENMIHLKYFATD